MSWTDNKEWLEAIAKSYDKDIKLYTKDNWLCRAIAWILFVLSFGKASKEYNLTHVAMALANYHFYPKELDTYTVERLITHEGQHTKQLRILGFGIHPLVGLPLGAIIYFLFPLPFVFALGRFYMELDADRAEYIELAKSGLTGARIDWMYRHAERRANSLSGSLYLCALPACIGKPIYRRVVRKVIDDQQTK